MNALARYVSEAYYREGDIYISVRDIEAIADAEKVPEHEARSALALLDEHGLLMRDEGGHSYRDGIGLLLRYEEADRGVAYERNKLRREILRLAAAKQDEGRGELRYFEGDHHFVEVPWSEAFAASQVLEYLGFLETHPSMGHNFRASITTMGYELQRSEDELAQTLPINAAEDGVAANVAPDVQSELIRDVDELVISRGWSGAMQELRRGDEQYRDGDWTNAVREYYAALESALKHRLDDGGSEYSRSASLKDLARQAASEGVIPTNYQALFGYIDSIRSPRSHGRGAKPDEIEIGQPEALLMANHVRALIIYLGHRA